VWSRRHFGSAEVAEQVTLKQRANGKQFTTLVQLLEDGKVKPVVDRRYPLSEIADAFRYLGEGHAQGKVVITI